MKKLLFVAPHLSTGGLPQYLTKKIELLKDEFDIHLVEWVDCTGGILVVQRDKIRNLVNPNKFYTLYDDKHELINIIDNIQPDIIHLEEIPEFFMDYDVAKKLYNQNRKYILIETSHDSSYNTENKQFFPDKFMFVSNWQINQYKNINIPKVLVEYPIEYKTRPDRTVALQKLGLDPNKKHVLHVGLFTPRKNQAEFFEYARSLPEYQFHCVGNQAENFQHYWKPLMENKPSNITWWNERRDVDNFYSAVDLFLFTSRGNENDKETMPLVIREAISWNLPVLIYNLPVYLDYFDTFENIFYLEFDDFEKNCNVIDSVLQQKSVINISEEAIVISTYPVLSSIVETTKECILALKETGRKIILTSHVPIPIELQELVDYCVYDKNNILTKHSFYNTYNAYFDSYDVYINLRGNDNDVYHGPTVYTNYYNAASLAQHIGIKKLFYVNYDYILNDASYIDSISEILNKKPAYCLKNTASEGNQLMTWFLAIKPEFLTNNLPFIENSKQYDDLQDKFGSESNSLENLIYGQFKDYNNIHWVPEDIVRNKFNHKDYSRVEYYTVLPTQNENEFVVYVKISNSYDSKKIEILTYDSDVLVDQENFEVDNKIEFYRMLFLDLNKTYNIVFKIYDKTSGNLIEERFASTENLKNNGLFTRK
jgi:glycosyltransferase involved in cell wall biosynthesis